MAEDPVGGGAYAREGTASAEWGVVFKHAVVVVVRDVQVAARVHRDTVRRAQAAGAEAPRVAAIGIEVGLADHQVSDTAVNQGGYIFVTQHPVVHAVTNVQAVGNYAFIDRHGYGTVQAVTVDEF